MTPKKQWQTPDIVLISSNPINNKYIATRHEHTLLPQLKNTPNHNTPNGTSPTAAFGHGLSAFLS